MSTLSFNWSTPSEETVEVVPGWEQDYYRKPRRPNFNNILGVAVAIIVGIVAFLVISNFSKNDFPKEKEIATENKKSQPNYEQPDLAPKTEYVITQPNLKPKKYIADWQIASNPKKFNGKIKGFGNPGDVTDENSFEEEDWQNKLGQIILHVKELRQKDVLYHPSVLKEMNTVVLIEIIEMCTRHNVNVNEILSEALGKNFVMYVIFVRNRAGDIHAVFLLLPPDISNPMLEMWEYADGLKSDFIGYMKIKGSDPKFANSFLIIREYGFVLNLLYKYQWEIFKNLKELLDPIFFEDGLVPVTQPLPAAEPSLN